MIDHTITQGEDSEQVVDSHALRSLAESLGEAFRALIEAIPDGPHKPTPLARLLGVNRVIASKLLNALSRDDPFGVLEKIPGPETLRAITQIAPQLGVPEHIVNEASEYVDRFAEIIRHHFGTRSALNAAISAHSLDVQTRFVLSSRYQVFQGMRQILGVEAMTWLTSMIFAPAPDDDDRVAVTTIHGTISLRRLRPDANISFTFGPPFPSSTGAPVLTGNQFSLEEFYTHKPVALESSIVDNKLVHRLADSSLGKKAVADMLAVSHAPHGSQRYATPERRRGGLAVFPDVPVKTLVCDALLHDSVFPGASPELIVYNPGAAGPANPNDPTRDIHKIAVPERIAELGKQPDRFDVTEVPNYEAMIRNVCGKLGHDPDAFRVFRLRMSYPVHGFQFVMAFDAPDKG